MHIARPRLLILGALLAAVIAACGGGANPSPSGSEPSVGPTASSGPPSIEPSAQPTAAASASSNLAIPHADPELESVLPDEFEGATLEKLSVDPISSVGNAGAEPVRTMAAELGDGSGNFSLAYASNPLDPTFNCVALRIPGGSPTALAERFAALTLADTRGSEAEQVELGGKSVTHVTAPGNPIGDSWIYAVGDTVFAVQANTPERAAALLELLP